MLTGKFHGKDIGTSDVWRFNDAVRSGLMDQDQLVMAEAAMCPQSRALRGNGHGLYHGVDGRGAGLVAAP